MKKSPLLSHLLLFWAIFFYTSGYSQNEKGSKVEILNTDELVFDEAINAKRLIGNVKFRHDEVLMFCDSAYVYDNNSLDAFSNVRIEGDKTILTGNKLFYDGQSKKANITGNVFLQDEEMTLKTSSLVYDLKLKTAFYSNGATINNIKENNTLVSKKGNYFSNTKTLFFKDSVVITDKEYTLKSDTVKHLINSKTSFFFGPTEIKSKEALIYANYGKYEGKNEKAFLSKRAKIFTEDQILEGDSIFYDQKKGIGEGFNNVIVIDTTNNNVLKSNYAFYDEEKEFTLMTRKVEMIMISDGDSLFLHADTLVSFPTDTSKKIEPEKSDTGKKNEDKIIKAFHHVKFFRKDLQGVCDTLIYSTKDSLIQLLHNPIIWSDENQLTSEKIELTVKSGEIRQIEMINSAFMVSQVDTIKFNQVKGKSMKAFFEKGEIYKVDVYSNAESIYYVREEDSTMVGVNKTISDDLKILIEENEVKSISFYKKPIATLYPIKDANPNEVILKNFIWQPKKRPKKREDIFEWVP